MLPKRKLTIIKWNIYNANVPFITDFTKTKTRPVILLVKVGGNAIILPISSQVNKQSKHDIKIMLNEPSLIKIANIQSISQNAIKSPYYLVKTKQLCSLTKEQKRAIEYELFDLIFGNKKKA